MAAPAPLRGNRVAVVPISYQRPLRIVLVSGSMHHPVAELVLALRGELISLSHSPRN